MLNSIGFHFMYPLNIISEEEISAIDQLGGIYRVSQLANQILREHKIDHNLFSMVEIKALQRRYLGDTSCIKFCIDRTRSVSANFEALFQEASDIQKNLGGSNYVGAMLQHLVGAKLDLILGEGIIKHHGFSVADHSTDRNADFHINGVAIHVTTHPGEAMIRKAASNLNSGLRPLIITLGDGVEGAAYLLKNTQWAARIDVLDATQFLTANVYERSLLQSGESNVTMRSIVERYNEIVALCETDPVLRIRLES